MVSYIELITYSGLITFVGVGLLSG